MVNQLLTRIISIRYSNSNQVINLNRKGTLRIPLPIIAYQSMRAKLVLCILLTIICASSKSQTLVGKTIKGDSLILTDSTGHVYFEAIQPIAPATATAKKKKMLRPQRIDREIMKTTFIPKGQWMAGGTVSYSEHEEDNLNFLVLKDVKGLGYTFSLSPYLGYFFKDNVAAGVRFAYNRTYLDMSNFELNLGEDFNINLKDLYWLEHKYEVSGFLRTYMPLGKAKFSACSMKCG